MKHCVIMAGGSGTRFWPRSRENKSKQFLNMIGKESPIQATVNRFLPVVATESIWIVAKESQKNELKKHSRRIHPANFIFEPEGRNTAPCAGLAALEIRRRDPDALLIITPSDHLIENVERFHQAIAGAVELAEKKACIVTLGIEPDTPSTAYGYIQVDEKQGRFNKVDAFNVKTFAEKPNLATASRFISSGDFYWNSGIFIFKAETYLEALKKYIPDLYTSLMEIDRAFGTSRYQSVLKEKYRHIRSVSIDYGIMEQSKEVYMLKGAFTWYDLGSWNEVYKLSAKDKNGNAVNGMAKLLDATNSYVYAPEGFVAIVGLDNVVVVQEGNVTLICDRSKSEDVKRMVDLLKKDGLEKYV